MCMRVQLKVEQCNYYSWRYPPSAGLGAELAGKVMVCSVQTLPHTCVDIHVSAVHKDINSLTLLLSHE